MRLRSLLPVVFASLLAVAACGGRAEAPATPAALARTFTLVDEAGKPAPIDAVLAPTKLTVFLFFTSECPVQKAHDARVRELVALYAPRDVGFVAVASEAGIDLAAERESTRRRALGMPLLEDQGAALADALGVDYSTHVVLVARDRSILYSGAFDSERSHLTDHAVPHLRNALDSALAGRPVTVARAEPLGCPLRKH